MKKFYILGMVRDNGGPWGENPVGLVALAHDISEAVRLASAFSAGVNRIDPKLSFEVTDVALVKRRGATYSVELS